MEPPTSIHLGTRYERVPSPADDLERGQAQAAWAAPRAAVSRKAVLVAFGAGVVITALGYHVGGSVGSGVGVGDRLPGRLGEWVGGGKGVVEEEVISAGESGAIRLVVSERALRQAGRQGRLRC